MAARPRTRPDFGDLLLEARAFKRRRRNPPAPAQFAAVLLNKGYSLHELPEEELRGVAHEIVGEDGPSLETWLEDFAAYLGQPA